jgi:hypothetical protein
VSQADKIQMAKLARLERRSAELLAEIAEVSAARAKIFECFAEGESVDLPSGRRRPRESVPEITPVSELTSARAQAALRRNDHRRRLRT